MTLILNHTLEIINESQHIPHLNRVVEEYKYELDEVNKLLDKVSLEMYNVKVYDEV